MSKVKTTDSIYEEHFGKKCFHCCWTETGGNRLKDVLSFEDQRLILATEQEFLLTLLVYSQTCLILLQMWFLSDI